MTNSKTYKIIGTTKNKCSECEEVKRLYVFDTDKMLCKECIEIYSKYYKHKKALLEYYKED